MKNKIVLAAALFLCNSLFAQQKYSKETLQKIAEVENNITGRLLLNDEKPSTIAQRMAKYKVKGMSVAVIHDYKIVWAKGYGWADEAAQKPVTTETLFEPGSISKTLNAVGILKLVQDKKLDLNTDINTYLTSWKFPYDSLANGKKITLAHLLSHTAGLSVHGFPGHDINGPTPTIYEVLDGKKPSFTPAVRSIFEPGIQFKYSGGGTSISQVILTDVTKQPYEAWMYENVLKPIGMRNSTYAQPLPKDKRDLAAQAYNWDGTPVAGKFHVYPEQAAAGLWMTPTDLANYIIDIQLAYKGTQKSKVLSDEMVKLHITPYIENAGAMGTFIEDAGGAKYFAHGAGNDGFCGHFMGSLEGGYGIAIFLNTDDGRILPEVINSVAKAYNWKNYYNAPKHKTTVQVGDDILKTYEGVYMFENSLASIVQKDSAYYFWTDGMYARMYFKTPNRFFNEEFSSEKEFVKDAHGNITGYTRWVEDKEYPRAVKITSADTLNFPPNVFVETGWHLLEHKKFTDAGMFFARGVQLYPDDLNMKVNLAHAYLFGNNYDKAMAIYGAHLGKSVRPEYSWEQLIRDDYAYFKAHNFDVTAFDKVFDALKIAKP